MANTLYSYYIIDRLNTPPSVLDKQVMEKLLIHLVIRYSLVKKNDMNMLGRVNKGGELSNDESFIVSKFSALMRIGKDDSCFGSCEANFPRLVSGLTC